MPTSEARILANRKNASKSTRPDVDAPAKKFRVKIV